jgi:hypothetical protein
MVKPKIIDCKLLLLGLSIAIIAPVSTAKLDASVGEIPTLLASETATESAEVQLARYLTEIGAQMFGAYWCPHCHHQRERFGQDAFQLIDYVECDPRGEDARAQLCRDEQIEGYPTWKINGQLYPGDRSLEELADLSGYPGSRDFQP